MSSRCNDHSSSWRPDWDKKNNERNVKPIAIVAPRQRQDNKHTERNVPPIAIVAPRQRHDVEPMFRKPSSHN